MRISYNQSEAQRFEQPKRKAIMTSGAYVFNILQCAWSQSDHSQAEFLDFVLADTQSDAKVLTRIVTKKADGDPAFGVGFVLSMMGLLGVNEIEERPGKVKSMNGTVKDGYRVTALEKKTLGFVLQYVEEIDDQGFQVLNERDYPRYRMEVRGVFDPNTRQTNSEKIAGAPAARVDAMLARLEDVKGKPNPNGNSVKTLHKAAQSTPESVMDDCPF